MGLNYNVGKALKIRGRFLALTRTTTEKDDFYFLEYIRENGKWNGRTVRLNFMNEFAENAKTVLDKMTKIMKSKDLEGFSEKEVEYIMETSIIDILWPQIYVAYRRGENLNQFFESSAKSGIQQGEVSENIPAIKGILTERCKLECIKRKLPKGETITPEMKYDIAKSIGMKVPAFKNFKARNPTYQLISKMMSQHGYSRKPLSKLDK